MTAKVAGFFRSQGVKVLDLTDHLDGRPYQDLVVNELDFHPNVAVHSEIAELLAAEIESADQDRAE